MHADQAQWGSYEPSNNPLMKYFIKSDSEFYSRLRSYIIAPVYCKKLSECACFNTERSLEWIDIVVLIWLVEMFFWGLGIGHIHNRATEWWSIYYKCLAQQSNHRCTTTLWWFVYKITWRKQQEKDLWRNGFPFSFHAAYC